MYFSMGQGCDMLPNGCAPWLATPNWGCGSKINAANNKGGSATGGVGDGVAGVGGQRCSTKTQTKQANAGVQCRKA